jgi:hypothetical protein
MAHKDNGGWLPGYRGFVDHGVDAPDYEGEESGWAETPGLVQYEKAVDETAPIAVKVISDPQPRSRLEWRVTNMYLTPDSPPVLVAGLNPNRKTLSINAQVNSQSLYLGPDSSVNRMTGADIGYFPNPLTAVTEVWAVLLSTVDPDDGFVSTPNPVTLTIVSQYEVEL